MYNHRVYYRCHISWWIYNRQQKTADKQDKILQNIERIEVKQERILEKVHEFEENHDEILKKHFYIRRENRFMIRK